MSDPAETRGSGFAAWDGDGSESAPTGTPWLMGPVEFLDKVLRWVLTAIMIVLLIAALTQVTARYLLEIALVGPSEIARYMMIGGTFIAIPVLARSRNHIAVDALQYYLPRHLPVLWLNRAILLIEIAFLIVFGYYAGVLVGQLHASGSQSTGLHIPSWIPMLPVLAGAALGALVTAALLVETFLNPPLRSDESQGSSMKESRS